MHTQSKFRLLVVRLGAMGDILHALPAVTALRRAHPSWVIDWVIEPAWCSLLTANCELVKADSCSTLVGPWWEGNPAVCPAQPVVNRLHLAPAKAWGRHPLRGETARQIKRLRRMLREYGYDAVLDFQGAVRSALIGRLSGAGRRIGESHPREWAAKWFFTERVSTTGRHVIEQDLELASSVAGDALESVPPLLPLDSQAEAWCDELFSPLEGKPAVLLNPGAGWGSKRWPVERFAVVAAALAARGFHILVNAGPGEENLADAIQSQANGAALPVRCSLPQLIALTRRVALVVGGDTGPIHLACALGRPVVGIYGPTDPARNGPYGTRFKVLRSPISVRNHARLEDPEAGLLTISPQDVLGAIDEVLSTEAAR